MIEKIDVTGDGSNAYIRKQLLRGRSLSDGLKNLPIEKGTVYAFVPSEIELDKLYRFENGGIYSSDEELRNRTARFSAIRNDALTPISVEIERLITTETKHCCLFEDPVLWPKDEELKNNGIEFVCLGDKQVFYFFNRNNTDLEKIKQAILVSDSYVFTCALSSLDINLQSAFSSSKEITTELLDEFVRNVFVFFIGAYDGEGYLMWVKKV
ncbi:hypothetical protein Q4E93_21795 [Flavitalea sp. BT771]|uniref:hypothetical protein n=1 Tax=Flavitalea sp. BT771 TaxID=3063329 RepID=UPI0026E1B975|nr:hypothetical protein [Flavitalea sp. BT771]MDO6433259.1 hypothetical protein [Flavitalea sp. BT771]